MDNQRTEETRIYNGPNIYRSSDKELEMLGKTQFTNNENYKRVLQRIPSYFNMENSPFVCMMLAFNYGKIKGIQRDKNKWNAMATFCNMKAYASQHNGALPGTLEELKEWQKEVCEIVKKS